MECAAVEDRRKLVGEACVMKRNRAEDVRCFSKTVGIYARLASDAAPRLVERAVEPEARLVFEEDDAATGSTLFLIEGNDVRSHAACLSRSARASRFRGRCTENPS